jgi:hypothetical protein
VVVCVHPTPEPGLVISYLELKNAERKKDKKDRKKKKKEKKRKKEKR